MAEEEPREVSGVAREEGRDDAAAEGTEKEKYGWSEAGTGDPAFFIKQHSDG